MRGAENFLYSAAVASLGNCVVHLNLDIYACYYFIISCNFMLDLYITSSATLTNHPISAYI
jgi:hypothetical protein